MGLSFGIEAVRRCWGNQLNVLTSILVLICLACGCQGQDNHNNYVIKYLIPGGNERNWGGGAAKVVCVDTRNGHTWNLKEQYHDVIRYYWCNEWDSSTAFPPQDTLPVNWSDIPVVDSLLTEVRIGASLSEPVFVIAGPVRSCVPEKGIQAVIGSIKQGESRLNSTYIYRFYCIYNINSDEITFVDADKVPSEYDYRNRQVPFFDSRAQYLYYRAFGAGKRFDLITHRIDTILAGDTPIIPWNAPMVIVWDKKEKLYSRLDDSLHIKGKQISGDLNGEVLSALVVSDSTVLINVCMNRGMDYDFHTIIYELDFGTGTINELFGGIAGISQLVDAKLVE